MNESMFDVAGADGLVRRGILTEAAEPNGTVVVLLPSGFKHRVGSHRINVRLARHLAGLGFSTLRFDPAGFGESDGTLSVVPFGTLSARLEEGYFVGEVMLAVQALHERMSPARVVLGGLCAGGVTATLAAAHAGPALVQGVLSLGLPVLTLGQLDVRRMPRTDVARRRLRNYAQKLVSPAAWLRLLRGQSDFGHIGRNLRAALSLPKWGTSTTAPPAQENPHFTTAFDCLRANGVPQLFVYGTSDNRWLEFEQTFLAATLRHRMKGDLHAVACIDRASHELHFEPAKRAALDVVAHWLQQLPPVAPR